MLPIPNRNGQPPKSSKSATPAIAFARRVGELLPSRTTLKGSLVHFVNEFPSGRRPTDSNGRLRRLPGLRPIGKKLTPRSGDDGSRFPKLGTSQVHYLTPAAPLLPPHHRLRTPRLLRRPAPSKTVAHPPYHRSQPHRPALPSCPGLPPSPFSRTGCPIGPWRGILICDKLADGFKTPTL